MLSARTGLSLLLMGVALGGALSPRTAHGQTTATFDLAVYIPQPVQIVGDRTLRFGGMVAGGTTTITANDASARSAQFTVSGAGCAEADVAFILPATIPGPSGATLPVDSWTGSWAGGASVSYTAFTPSLTPARLQFDRTSTTCGVATGSRSDDETGQLVIRIGGTARPAGNQTPGVYSGTLGIQVTYVGF